MKLQNKVQKIICYIVLATSAIAFIFSLGLATNIYDLIMATDYGVAGVELVDEIQPINRRLVIYMIILILLSLFLFITKTHNRRRYYISNYITSILFAIVGIGVAAWSFITISNFKTRFLTEVDFEMWFSLRELLGIPDFPYSESTLWLDFNIITPFFIILSSLLLLGNIIWKIMLMRYEDKLLSGLIKPQLNSCKEAESC